MLSCQEIILIILSICVIYLLYNQHCLKIEKFSTVDDINQAINDIYKADVNAIRNLSNIATEIKNNNDSFTIPANKVTVPGYFDIVQLRGAVIAWSLPDIPKGWAICDGQKYKLDSNYNAVVDSNGMQTPDLRGRFVLGSGQGTNLTNRVVNETGGLEKVTLTIDQMPVHSHSVNDAYFAEYSWPYNLGGSGDTDWDNGYYTRNINTGNTGGDKSHENMPPYYVLTYIMKL